MCGNKIKMYFIEVKRNFPDLLLSALIVFYFLLTVWLKVIKLIFPGLCSSRASLLNMACYVLSMNHPAFFYTDRFRWQLHVMQYFVRGILRLCNYSLLSILLCETCICTRAGNMLLHFSFPNINKRACRVLKWLAIETIDEQLFLHVARTGQFQTENICFWLKLPIPFAFALNCLSLTLCIKIKTVHSDLSSFPAWQLRWIYSHRQWLAVVFVKAALRQATARAQLRKTVKYTKIRPDSLLQSF